MYTSNLKLLLVVGIFILTIITSCEQENPCDGVSCENGGIEVILNDDCTCDCPVGYAGDNCEVFDASQVQFLLDSGNTPIELYNGGISLEDLYGKTYLDGMIFYLNTNNGTGMVAAFEDHDSMAEWGCYDFDVPGLNNVPNDFPTMPETIEGTRIGDGFSNTNFIIDANCVSQYGGNTAAKLCRDIGAEWFLPSRGELNMMFTHLFLNNMGNFESALYWSSTESTLDQGAWGHYFQDDTQQTIVNRNGALRVRAAKAF